MGEAARKRAITESEMTLLIGSKSCRSCEWRLKMHGKLFCRLNPPQNIGGVVPGPRGEPVTVFVSSYPEVNADVPCGQYQRNHEYANEEMRDAAKEAAALPFAQ